MRGIVPAPHARRNAKIAETALGPAGAAEGGLGGTAGL
jgi:hypothetical protein